MTDASTIKRPRLFGIQSFRRNFPAYQIPWQPKSSYEPNSFAIDANKAARERDSAHL
jgi:hypothetical protein